MSKLFEAVDNQFETDKIINEFEHPWKNEIPADLIDKLKDNYAGQTISKNRDKAESEGGLIYVANEIGADDFYDVLKALEVMCSEGLAREIDDSTYKINECEVVNEDDQERSEIAIGEERFCPVKGSDEEAALEAAKRALSVYEKRAKIVSLDGTKIEVSIQVDNGERSGYESCPIVITFDPDSFGRAMSIITRPTKITSDFVNTASELLDLLGSEK